MIVSRRIMVLFFLFALLVSLGVSFIVQFLYHTSASNLPQFFALLFVLIIIAISGKLLHYQQILNRAKMNLDEAQQLASLGSWERNLITGKGYWSDNHYRLFHLIPRQEAPTLEDFFEMIHSVDRQKVRETVQGAISSSGSYEIKYRMEGDLENRIFLSRGKVLLSEQGKPATLIGSVQDVTEKQQREQLREELLRQKDFFISRLGHDLKTPLTPLVALLPIIRSRTEDLRQKELLDLCIGSSNQINELVTKTLRLARLTSTVDSKSHTTQIPLKSVADSAISNIINSENKNITVQNLISTEISVLADSSELEEVFLQLFSNTIKFSRAEPVIILKAVSAGGIVTVSVQDNGIGLLPEELVQIFDDFYQADPSRHQLGSSGLGLPICRRIIEKYGGRISATSPGRNGGTIIDFTLEAGGNYMENRVLDSVTSTITPRIMLVDDEECIRETVAELLDSEGISVITAVDGQDCLHKLREGFRGVILMDVMMPGMDGWAVIREMERGSLIQGNIIAMLTAMDVPDERMEGLQDVVIDYITKPFEPLEFIATVRKYLTLLKELECES